jgi:CDP-paratose 2-epimerase
MSAPEIGLAEHFRLDEHEHAEAVLEDLHRLGVRRLKIRLSWGECATPEGARWSSWLITRAARRVEVVPSFAGVPVQVTTESRASAPPRDAEAFAGFIEAFVQRHGAYVQWVQLWEDALDLQSWDWRLDPGWRRFAQMIAAGARKAKAAGKKVALGGAVPFYPPWLDALAAEGALENVEAIALRRFPGVDPAWTGWTEAVATARQILDRRGVGAELWIDQTGCCTSRHDERQQLCELLDAMKAPASRLYWHSARDKLGSEDGLRRADGSPKLLMRMWLEHGLDRLEWAHSLTAPRPVRSLRGEKHTTIFGGAGFIGSNLADALLREGRKVLVFDSLERPSVERNLRWLQERHGDRLGVLIGDVRDGPSVRRAVENAAEVFHFAAQVAVTTSLIDPIRDFEVNARGTLQVLEAARQQEEPPKILFTSTNKVYGGLEDVPLRVRGRRYEPQAEELRPHGISEERALKFESPYGCSKGAADQYVLDWARSFGLRAVVFRMSCIYGPRQYGNEDQGWVAHFLIRALERKPITVYGDGRQVRDILFVEDLVRAMRLAMDRIEATSGHGYNIGGGPGRTVSLLELLDRIEALAGRRPEIRFEDWRTGDQRYYVSDVRRFEQATGWTPRVSVEEGVAALFRWLEEALYGGRRVHQRTGSVEAYAR